jgi:hypothetical protein
MMHAQRLSRLAGEVAKRGDADERRARGTTLTRFAARADRRRAVREVCCRA